jgi:hypothetical protein
MQHYGIHDFNSGEADYLKVHQYGSPSDMAADSTNAAGRFCYVVSNGTFYQGTTSGWLALPQGNPSTPVSNINILDNGSFNVWQRGTQYISYLLNPTPSMPQWYLADRWFLRYNGGVTGSYAAASVTQSAPSSSVATPGMLFTGEGINHPILHMQVGQRLLADQAQPLINNVTYFQFLVNNGTSAPLAPTAYLYQLNGTYTTSVSDYAWPGGTWSSAPTLLQTLTPTLLSGDASTGWSLWGCQIQPTGVYAPLELYIDFNNMAESGSNGAGTMTLTQAQLAVGTAPSAFTYEPPQVALMRCQRFLRVWNSTDIIIGSGYVATNGTAYEVNATINYSPMWTTPAVGVGYGNSAWSFFLNIGVVSPAGFSYITESAPTVVAATPSMMQLSFPTPFTAPAVGYFGFSGDTGNDQIAIGCEP